MEVQDSQFKSEQVAVVAARDREDAKESCQSNLLRLSYSPKDDRRAEITEILRKNNTSVSEIAKLFFVPCRGSMPSIETLGINSDSLPEGPVLPFVLHPVASNEKIAMKYNNMNKFGFHSQKCNLVTTDRERKCNTECQSVGFQTELINLIKKSAKPNHQHNRCSAVGNTIARTNNVLTKHKVHKQLKRALEKLSRMKSDNSTFNEVLALISQNEVGIAFKVLKRFGNNPSKLLEMTKKILDFQYSPYLGNEESTIIKKYMMIKIIAGSQALQVLSYFDYQSQHFAKSIREKVLARIKIRIPLSNLLPAEKSLNKILDSIEQDLEKKKIKGPLIVTSAEDEVKLDESIEYDLRENRVIGFAVDSFSSEIKDIAEDPEAIVQLEYLVSEGVIVPADLGQTFMLSVSLADNTLLSYPLCVLGRSSRSSNSYKDFIILKLVTTVVAK